MEYKHNSIYENLFSNRNIFIDTVMILVSVAFLAGMAQLRVPLWPVPITMQTFGVFTIAFFFGSKKGVVSMLTYVLAGLAGIGVFAGYKSGIISIIGPTGGYLLGFIAAVYVVGILIEKGWGRTKTSVLNCIVIGNLIIYTFGLIGLKLSLSNLTTLQVLNAGLFPFLIGDAIKIVAAVALFPFLWKGSEKIIN